MEKNQILEDLKQKGYQIPDEAIKLIEKVKRKDQIKSPDSEADKSGKSKKSFEGIFPAPEGTRWQDVHFNLEEGGSLKIKVKSKERTLLLDDINRYFPQNQQRDLLIRVIRSPGGVLDNQNFIKLGENAFKNRKHIVYKLNKTLRELFGVDGNPIIFDKQNESYKALFCVYSDWKPSGMSD